MNLNFSPKTVAEWNTYLSQTTRATWMQSIPYATAAAQADYRTTKFATIEQNNLVIGIVAIQELKLGFIHIVGLYRGPLWMKGQDTRENLQSFTELFHKTYPKRLFRRIRWMPEWDTSDERQSALIQKPGYQKLNSTFQTLWVDLTPEISEIRKRLQQKWRNALNKAERSPIQVSLDREGRFLNQFLREYEIYKTKKNFTGPSARFFKAEVECALKYKDALILWARNNQVPVAGIILIKHGKTASYRLGWNSSEGRMHNAHYALLWKAIEVLKKLEIEQLDLGGIYPDENDGLTHFKLGLSGSKFQTEVFK